MGVCVGCVGVGSASVYYRGSKKKVRVRKKESKIVRLRERERKKDGKIVREREREKERL